jgi:hypothetical protein
LYNVIKQIEDAVKHKISKATRKALEECGRTFKVEEGKKHFKIWVGNIMCGVQPKGIRGDGQSNGFAEKNVIAQIRRAARGVPA